MFNNTVNCPVCEKKKNKKIGVNRCDICCSLFEVLSTGEINLVKRKKLDFWPFLVTLPFTILAVLIIFFIISNYVDFEARISLGVILILPPFIQFFYFASRGYDEDAALLFELIRDFIKGKLRKQDIGRILTGYFTLFNTIIGFMLIIWSLFTR